MIRECIKEGHGFFRGEECPECGQQGKFILSDDELERLSRTIAGILRHFPEKFGLTMDEHGWININEFVEAIKERKRGYRWLKQYHIEGIVGSDEKGRYDIKEGKIRATYGHSVKIDLDLPTDNIPEILYYPAKEEEKDLLLQNGLKPGDRRYVHLSEREEDAKIAGSFKAENPIILKIDTKSAIEGGVVIKRAGKKVYIADEIPSAYLSE